MADTKFKDALPVSITGAVNSRHNLFDVLHEAFGNEAFSIASVRIGYWDDRHLQAATTPSGASKPFSYWDPNNAEVTRVLKNGNDIGGSDSTFLTQPVNAADFKNVEIEVGNNILSNVRIQIPESSANGETVWRELYVTTLPTDILTPHAPSDHAPTAADIVDVARDFATAVNGTPNGNDCHNIATAIAAGAGATFDPRTGNTDNPHENQEGGFWRVAYRGVDSDAVDNWQSKVQPGDIVRMERTSGGVHTVTVTAGLNDKGEIQVVDNRGGTIREHWQDYDNNTVKGSITIYRLTTNDQYLIDQSSDGHGNTILGTHFNDLIRSGSGADDLRGGEGNDTLRSGGGKDTLRGDKGNDTLDGGSGADSMTGGAGDDTYIVDNADDTVDERIFRGFDPVKHTPVFRDSGGIDEVKTTLRNYSIDHHDNSHVKGIVENLTYTGQGSFIGRGNASDNEIRAGIGDDQLFGADGADRLFGGNGHDVLDGGTGSDWMDGGAGNDKYFVDHRGDTVVEVKFVTDPVTGKVSRVDAGGIDEIVTTLNKFSTDNAFGKIENLTFNGSGDFEGTGNGLDNKITGGSGNDTLKGGAGEDHLRGGAGHDTLDGGTGADTLRGGSGNDTYIVDNKNDVVDDTLRLGAHFVKDGGGIDEVRTTLSDYTLSSSTAPTADFRGVIENLTYKGTGSFDGHGNEVANVITGGSHADKLFGNGGADTLLGGAGDDSLFGGSGSDVLNGGKGADKLNGGSGADRYVFALGDNGVTATTADHITRHSFEKGDTLDVSDFVASHRTIEKTQNFHGDIAEALSFAKDHIADKGNFAGSAVLTDSSSHNVFVFLDQDGDHKFESAIVLDGADALTSDLHTEIMNHQLFV